MFTEGGLQICHLLEVVDETRTHLTLEQGVSPKEIRYHLIFTDQPISERRGGVGGVNRKTEWILLFSKAKEYSSCSSLFIPSFPCSTLTDLCPKHRRSPGRES